MTKPRPFDRRKKLTPEQVVAIRACAARGGVPQTAIATEYGVSQKCVSEIVRRRIWKRVP